MAKKNDSTLKSELLALLYSSGQKHIGAVELRNRLYDMLDSFPNLVDDKSQLGLRKLDGSRAYEEGEGFIFEGALWESVNGHQPGEDPNTAGNATFQRLTAIPTIENFDLWDNGETYNQTDTVRRGYRLFESLVDENTGNDPLLENYPGSIIWKEVAASENKWGEQYVAEKWYTKRQVVYNAGSFYWLNIVADKYLSTDFETELGADIWVVLGSGGGGALKFNAADIAERDVKEADMEVGDEIFVYDASADPTVDSGWAKYRLEVDGFEKIAEQEGLDLIYETKGEVSGIRTITAAAHTIELTDKGKLLRMERATAQVVTIPADDTLNFNINTKIDFQNVLQGRTEFVAAAGVTIEGISDPSADYKIELRYGGARLIKTGANRWSLIGNLQL